MYSSVWLFMFAEYSYCQGTRDLNMSIRLLNFSLPCDEFEAKSYLMRILNEQHVEFDKSSIKSLTYKVTNS